MAKDRFWFKHDLTARNDDKILTMLSDYGAMGYGLYWAIVERLHEEDNRIEFSERFCSAVGKLLQVKKDKVNSFIHACINEYELFNCYDGILSANRVEKNLIERSEISKLRAIAGQKGGKTKQMLAIAKQNLAEERREEEIREEENTGEKKKDGTAPKKFIKPKKEEVSNFLHKEKDFDEFTAMGFADRFVNYYESNGWKVGKNPMKNWKAAIATWISKDLPQTQVNGRKQNISDERTKKILEEVERGGK